MEFKEITEEIIISNDIDNLQLLSEKGFKPQLFVKYKGGREVIITGEDKIKTFFKSLW